MDTESNNQSKKNTSKTILVIILAILLMCVIVGMILLIAKPWEKHDTVTYQENPKLFCEQNPEHVLCSDEEISFWDDPVNYCLKNPDVQECEKQGETDFCEKNPSSVLCDKDPNNDYNWIDDSFEDAFENFGFDEDTATAYKDVFVSSMKKLTACLNAAGMHIDSIESYDSLANDQSQFDLYNAAQMLKISICTEEFSNNSSTSQSSK